MADVRSSGYQQKFISNAIATLQSYPGRRPRTVNRVPPSSKGDGRPRAASPAPTNEAGTAATTLRTTYSIVFICTGNRFRSPLAAEFVRHSTRGLPVRVDSFGTLELGAVPALEEAQHLAAAYGVDLSEHRTRCLGAGSLADADLVLGFEYNQIGRAVVDGGAQRHLTFTLPELVFLLGRIDPPEGDEVVERARRLVSDAAAVRDASSDHRDPPVIADPLGRGWRAYCEAAEKIADLTDALTSQLFAISVRAPHKNDGNS